MDHVNKNEKSLSQLDSNFKPISVCSHKVLWPINLHWDFFKYFYFSVDSLKKSTTEKKVKKKYHEVWKVEGPSLFPVAKKESVYWINFQPLFLRACFGPLCFQWQIEGSGLLNKFLTSISQGLLPQQIGQLVSPSLFDVFAHRLQGKRFVGFSLSEPDFEFCTRVSYLSCDPDVRHLHAILVDVQVEVLRRWDQNTKFIIFSFQNKANRLE